MVGDTEADYLSGLPDDQRETLTRANEPGLRALREYLKARDAVAFLGAGVSVPLYPLWTKLIGQLVEAAAHRLTEQEAATCRALATNSPEEVVEILRRSLGVAAYREVLRKVLGAKTDEISGRTWTPIQELICRCDFKGVVTTNYDPGIVDARLRVRTWLSVTGFTIWDDELALDGWRNSRIFDEVELPVLYAHGYFNRPDTVVLATTEYRRAYEGKLAKVLVGLVDREHLVWIGFSFADKRIDAIMQEVALGSGTRIEPGPAAEHVAVMPWFPDEPGNDPGILAQRAEIRYGARLVLYPAFGDDHSALERLLASLADPKFPPAPDLARGIVSAVLPGGKAEPDKSTPARWIPEPEPVAHFTGRTEELTRLDRWAADTQVSLIGVTAWGGAGKTALVTHWIQAGGAARRSGLRGVFGWSFYADPSAENWASALLEWAAQRFGIGVATNRPAVAVLALLRTIPLLLVLDGLEVVQEGPAGDGFGRLLDGTLREVLSGACRERHSGLVVLTSRFPFADLETFDGTRARMLEVPPFTPAEGSDLLAAADGDWLPDRERRDLVRAVDGHALAVTALAGLVADRPTAGDLAALRADLAAAARTDARVGRVLEFYAERLSEADRYLLAAVSLFARPVPVAAVLAVAPHETFGSRLTGWTPVMVQAAVRDRLGGLASWHPDATISAHPLVRDTFRSLAMDAAGTAAETVLAGVPDGIVTTRADALVVVEAIELLLDADQWRPADDLYRRRSDNGDVWKHLPAARLGQRAATAFVATPDRRDACAIHIGARRLVNYLTTAGVIAMDAGDVEMSGEYLRMAVRGCEAGDMEARASCLMNLADCLGQLGQMGSARDAAAEALSCAQTDGDRLLTNYAHALVGRIADLSGDAATAERHFITADRMEVTDEPGGYHLYSIYGSRWAERLARTDRPGPARALTDRNAVISREGGWKEDMARCDRVLGLLALEAGDTTAAAEHLAGAADCFRDGDYLTELADVLADLASYARATGEPDAAERHVAEAITIAAPRGLVPAQSAALVVRARIRADQAAAAPASTDYLAQGRDAADAALRLASRHQLAWQELDALQAHAALDQAESLDHGWAAKADALYARLVPPDLDPDPLATVERLVAEEEAAQEAADSNDDSGDEDEDY